MAIIAKARVAQLTAFPSSFAAAHWEVVESLELPFLKAPLSAAGLKSCGGKRRAGEDTRPYKNAETCPVNAVGADDLGGPRAHTVRPYREKKRAVNVLWERESPRRFAAPPFDKGGFGGRPHPGCLKTAFQESTLIRLAFGQTPSPLEGEGLRAARCAAPTAEIGPGALVRQIQARRWNHTIRNFQPS